MVDATHDSPDLNLYDGSAAEVVDYVVTLGANGLVSADNLQSVALPNAEQGHSATHIDFYVHR